MADRYAADLMSRPVETVPRSATLSEVATTMIEHDVGSVVVVEDAETMAGLLTTTDFVVRARDPTAGTATAGECMRTDVVTARRGTPASDVVASMLEHLVHHVPVVEDGRAVGMVTTLDVAAHAAKSL
jgi:signal-transduction protein with cAMP-binding, CBS, and nucleotidyltransferase domain